MSSTASPIGVVGLGLIGGAVTRRLIAAGFAVTGYDIDAAKAEALASRGLRPAKSLMEVAQAARRIVLAVFDTRQIEDAIEGSAGLLDAEGRDPRTIYVSLSTCDPERIAALGNRVRQRGATLLECPLSGTSDQVAKGDGVGLVAGDETCIAQIDDILAAICKRHHVLGALGNGNRTKLAINLILGLNRAALAEGLVFAERLNLPLNAFLDVARGSAAYSQVMDVKGGKMIARDFAPHGKIAQSHKDFSLIIDAAEMAGQELPFASVYREIIERCMAHDEGAWDNSAIIEEIRRRSLTPSGAL